MAGEASVVREEIWFDSSDGTSRIHGYLWWPPGVAEADDGSATGGRVDGAGAEAGPRSPGDADGAAEQAGGDAARQADDNAAGRVAASGDGQEADAKPERAEPGTGAGDARAAVREHEPVNPFERAARAARGRRRANAFEAAARRACVVAEALGTADDAAGEPDDGNAPSVVDEAPPVVTEPTPPEDARPAPDDEADAREGAEDDDVPVVRGVVQIVHGMAEYVGRYDEFARFLAEAGYIVCGHDHIGHGGSAPAGRLGRLPGGSKRVLVADVGRMRALVRERIGVELPHFLFGHSLGSFVVRAYLAREGAGLAGAVICGTGHVSFAKSALGNAASNALRPLHPGRSASPLLNAMGTGAYSRAIRHRRTANDWLSYDEANVDAYNADPLCGFPFSPGGYAAVTALTREVCTLRSARHVPRTLPLLFIGGDADPVGEGGEGVRAAAHLARVAGSADVTCMIYRHMRHEILNETDRRMVFDDVLFWLEVRS